MQIAIVFGVATYERLGIEDRGIKGFNWYFPKEDRGLVRYDATFNMTKEASQRFFIKTCKEINNIKCSSPACQKGNMLRVEAKPTCVMQDLLDFYHLNTGDASAEFVPEDKFDSNYQTFIKGDGELLQAPWLLVAPVCERERERERVLCVCMGVYVCGVLPAPRL